MCLWLKDLKDATRPTQKFYPLVNVYIAIENGHRNSGHFPINSMVDLSIFHS